MSNRLPVTPAPGLLEEAQIQRLVPHELPEGWQTYPHPESTRGGVGDAWVAAKETLALALPSVLAPPEVNVMLNCAHPDYQHLTIDGPEPFPISPRLTPDTGGGDLSV